MFIPVKNHTLGFNEVLKSIFCLLLVVETFSLKKVVEMLEEMVVGCQKVRWIWQMRQNFVAQFIQLLKHWFWDLQSGIVMEKNWALSVPVLTADIAVFGDLTDLLSIFFRCNGFAGIQKAVVGQTKQWPWPFYGASLALRNVLELFLSPTTELVICSCRLKSTFWCTSTIQLRNGSLMYYRIREDNTSKWWSVWFAASSRGTRLPELFHLSNFLQMPNDYHGQCWALQQLLM